ncbi:ankyrin repeat domain-containing protein [Rickettsiales endosymbiont of Stachyamoeba lipophora]|uniref:ankyrin repeat domain-containing protein n=1 Tax=Rickettsiales endosymbiont of Stachyamoeba lipophora TaxID=2486578 RepID=UPI000F64A73E|nr:ankyrin repeat domain-containing protein [Rickettsiales endosymbiont of Stachyamoeba lipophora]AZL15184.1 hypothetical protein EF513_01240 [Rickettsiales endosymbiont of Stachyamoeba lipophora]
MPNTLVKLTVPRIILATARGNIQEVKSLIEEGVDINTENILGETSLHCATKKRNIDMMELLLNAEKIDVNKLNSDKQTVLQIATRYNFLKGVELLLEHNADPTIVNCNLKTPFHIAIITEVSENNEKIIKLLLKALQKAKVNIKDFLNQEVEHFIVHISKEYREEGKKFTALQLAAMCSRLDLIPLLIKLGADEKIIHKEFRLSLKDIYKKFNHPSPTEKDLALFDQKIAEGIAARKAQERALGNNHTSSITTESLPRKQPKIFKKEASAVSKVTARKSPKVRYVEITDEQPFQPYNHKIKSSCSKSKEQSHSK